MATTSPKVTAPSVICWRRVAALRLAIMYSVWSAVGFGSLLVLACASNRPAARRSSPRDNWHHPFVMCRCVRDFATADCGSNGIRRQHKNESVGAINCGVDGLHPFFRRANVLPVHPRLSTTTFQSLIQATHKVLVLTR